MKKILWMSRHSCLPCQIAELERLFGEVKVISYPHPFDSAKDIVQRFRDGGYDDIVVVAPLSVLGHLVDLGIKPLWTEMRELPRGQEADVIYRNRPYRFEGFKRVKALHLEFEEV